MTTILLVVTCLMSSLCILFLIGCFLMVTKLWEYERSGLEFVAGLLIGFLALLALPTLTSIAVWFHQQWLLSEALVEEQWHPPQLPPEDSP